MQTLKGLPKIDRVSEVPSCVVRGRMNDEWDHEMVYDFGDYPHRLDLRDRRGLLVDQVRGKYCP